MKKESKPINYQDGRGYIQDILVDGTFEHATYIFTKAGTVRGNHYHKKTTQHTFVLEGCLEYHHIDAQGKHLTETLRAGDVVTTPPIEHHAIKTIEDTKILVLTHGPRGGDHYEDDTFRLETPIVREP